MTEVSKAGPYECVSQELVGSAFASIAYVEETESTNADAAALLEAERFGVHTIVAEYQRHGAGRKGRVWTAPAGTALLFTTILPGIVDRAMLWVVPYWVALAVHAALLEFGISTTLQWPNDLLLRERKVAGILCRSSVSASTARVACGVGINVRRPPIDAGIEPPPAFCDEVGPVERAALLRGILEQYRRRLSMLDDHEHVTSQWNEAAQLPGRRYRIQLDGSVETFEAIAQGLVTGGGLHVVRDGGSHAIVSLGDARVMR